MGGVLDAWCHLSHAAALPDSLPPGATVLWHDPGRELPAQASGTSTAQASGASTGTAVDVALARRDDPDEVVHLVCCRDVPWETASCGEPGGHANLAATVLCTVAASPSGS